MLAVLTEQQGGRKGRNSNGGENTGDEDRKKMVPVISGFVSHCKDFGVYYEGEGEPLEDFEQRSNAV